MDITQYYNKNTKNLVFSNNFNESTENVKWPDSLEKINFSYYFNQPLDFLPEGLTSITINNENYHHYLGNLPLSIQKIYLMEDIKLHDIVLLELKDKVEFK